MLKRLISLAAFALLITVVVGCTESSLTGDYDVAGAKPGSVEDGWLGNGMPSGAHFNLNLIGVPNDKTADMTGNNGRRIFVPLEGQTKIMLTEGEFQVLDANGTDGEAAFQLPNPDEDCDGVTEYSVFVRELGKPGGSAVMESCYTDVVTGEEYCASDVDGGVIEVYLSRDTGKPKTTNVSKNLLYVDYCASWEEVSDGVFECKRWTITPLFGSVAEDFFWKYDNDGLKLAQLRFYDVSTDTGYGLVECIDQQEVVYLPE